MAAQQYAKAQELGLLAWGLSLSKEEMAEVEPIAWMEADLIVDALLGTGIKGEPHGETAELIRLINVTRCPILSFDVPSGLSGDEGYILSPCIQASATMSIALPRLGLLEGWPVVRDVWVADMGIPPKLYEQMGLKVKDIFDGQSVVCLGRARKLKP
jgi:NAD(P)H-hydrate epimerase